MTLIRTRDGLNSLGDTPCKNTVIGIWGPVGDAAVVGISVGDQVGDSVGDVVERSAGDPVRDAVGNVVGISVGDPVDKSDLLLTGINVVGLTW